MTASKSVQDVWIFSSKDNMLVELKAVIKLDDAHLAQTINYCQAFNLPSGLLINFGAKSLEFKRAFNLNYKH